MRDGRRGKQQLTPARRKPTLRRRFGLAWSILLATLTSNGLTILVQLKLDQNTHGRYQDALQNPDATRYPTGRAMHGPTARLHQWPAAFASAQCC
jgi:hypothetical protein